MSGVFFFVHTMNVIGIGCGLNPNVLQNNFCFAEEEIHTGLE